jgi:COP9 signalosome complex subunit 1
MDIDVDETMQSMSTVPGNTKKPMTLPIDDMHPFELESYISNYTGSPAPSPERLCLT